MNSLRDLGDATVTTPPDFRTAKMNDAHDRSSPHKAIDLLAHPIILTFAHALRAATKQRKVLCFLDAPGKDEALLPATVAVVESVFPAVAAAAQTSRCFAAGSWGVEKL